MDETLLLPPSLRIRVLWIFQKPCGSCSDTASVHSCRRIVTTLNFVLIATLLPLNWVLKHIAFCNAWLYLPIFPSCLPTPLLCISHLLARNFFLSNVCPLVFFSS